MGPEAILRHINPEEVIKRLAASQGIDVLNLVRTMQEIEQERQQAMQREQAMMQQQQQTERMKTPMADPSKNPALARQLDPTQES
jgi:hypothetical protein